MLWAGASCVIAARLGELHTPVAVGKHQSVWERLATVCMASARSKAVLDPPDACLFAQGSVWQHVYMCTPRLKRLSERVREQKSYVT